MLNPRGCRGLILLIVFPFILIAVVAGLVNGDGTGATLPPAQLVFFVSIFGALTAGWLFVLSAWVPERIGKIIARITIVVLIASLFGVAIGCLWRGVELANERHADVGETWMYLLVGAFFAITLLLLVFRKRLPWNRGNSVPTGRAFWQRMTPTRVHLHRATGEARMLELGTTLPANDVQNSRGASVPSRLHMLLRDNGFEGEPEVVPNEVTIPAGYVFAAEFTQSGNIHYLLPFDDDAVRAVWQMGREPTSS